MAVSTVRFTDQEIETIKSLIRDHGCEYSLQTDSAEYQALGEKLSVLEPEPIPTAEELAEQARKRAEFANSPAGKQMAELFAVTNRYCIESMAKQVMAKSIFDGPQWEGKIGSTLRIRLPKDYAVKAE